MFSCSVYMPGRFCPVPAEWDTHFRKVGTGKAGLRVNNRENNHAENVKIIT